MKSFEFLREDNVPTFDKLVNGIKYLTQINNHMDALLTGLKLIGFQTGYDTVRKIQQQQEKIGYIPNDLLDLRNDVYKKMLQIAKKKLNPENYEKFYRAF